MNPFSEFVTALFRSGQLKLSMPEPISPGDLDRAQQSLTEFEAIYRQEFPFSAPQFDSVAVAGATWAALSFFRASQFVVYRDIPAETIAAAFSELDSKYPLDPNRPAVHYGVDLIFRFLPDLTSFARSSNRKDPLCRALHHWAVQWPLSSVGIELDGGLLETAIESSGLGASGLGASGLGASGLGASGLDPGVSQPDMHEPVSSEIDSSTTDSNTSDSIASDSQQPNPNETSLHFNIDPLVKNQSLWQTYVDRILQTQDDSRINDPRVIEKIKQSVGLHNTLAGKLKQQLEPQ